MTQFQKGWKYKLLLKASINFVGSTALWLDTCPQAWPRSPDAWQPSLSRSWHLTIGISSWLPAYWKPHLWLPVRCKPTMLKVLRRWASNNASSARSPDLKASSAACCEASQAFLLLACAFTTKDSFDCPKASQVKSHYDLGLCKDRIR